MPPNACRCGRLEDFGGESEREALTVYAWSKVECFESVALSYQRKEFSYDLR